MAVATVLLLIFIFLTAFYWIWVLYARRDEPPTFTGFLPFIGHSYKFINKARMLNVINEMGQFGFKNKGALTLWIGMKPFYVIADPDDALLISSNCLDRDVIFYKVGRPIMGNGLLTAPAPIWKQHRKVINPAFNLQVLDGFMPFFNKQGRQLVSDLSKEIDQGPFDHMNYLKNISLQIICYAAMGIDITNEPSDSLYSEACDKLSDLSLERYVKVWLHNETIYNFSDTKRRQDKYVKEFSQMSETALKRRRELIKRESIDTNVGTLLSGDIRKTIIDILLEFENKVFTEQDIKDEVNTIISAGHHTVAITLTYILTVIGSYPDIQDRIVAEFQAESQSSDDDVTRIDISRLIYLEAVIKETMRFYTLVPVVLRFIDKDIKIKNYTLKAGSDCIILSQGIHRHSTWGEDADKFNPDRWLNPATLPKNPNAFLGFGIGKRNCIGKTFAMMEMKTLLVHVLRRYRIRGDHTKLKMVLSLTTAPVSGHHICVEERIKQ